MDFRPQTLSLRAHDSLGKIGPKMRSCATLVQFFFRASDELHKLLAEFECCHVLFGEQEPLTVLTLTCKAIVPITFNSIWVVSFNLMNEFVLRRKLQANFIGATPDVIGLSDFMKLS